MDRTFAFICMIVAGVGAQPPAPTTSPSTPAPVSTPPASSPPAVTPVSTPPPVPVKSPPTPAVTPVSTPPPVPVKSPPTPVAAAPTTTPEVPAPAPSMGKKHSAPAPSPALDAPPAEAPGPNYRIRIHFSTKLKADTKNQLVPKYDVFHFQNNSDVGLDDKGRVLLAVVLTALVFALLIIILVVIVCWIMRSRHHSKPAVELMELPRQRIIWVPGRIEYWHQRTSSF